MRSSRRLRHKPSRHESSLQPRKNSFRKSYRRRLAQLGSLENGEEKIKLSQKQKDFRTETKMSERKPGLFESMALGGMAACFAVNFTHPMYVVARRLDFSCLHCLTFCPNFFFCQNLIYTGGSHSETVKTRMQVSGAGIG